MLSRYNIMLAGQYGVGKTSIFKQLKHKSGIEDSADERGLDRFTYQTKRDKRDIEVYLWDTGGIERYHDAPSCNYYRHCQAMILVYKAGDQQSLVALGDWISDAKTYSHMKDYLMLSLWENSFEEHATSLEPLVKTFMQHNGISESLYFKVSSKTGDNLKEAFESLIMALDKRSTSELSQSEEHTYVDLKSLGNKDQSDNLSVGGNSRFCRC